MSKRYQIVKRSMTGAGKIWKQGREVTAKLLAMSDEQFDAAIKKKRIVPYEATAVKVASTPPPPSTPVLRADRIEAAIKDLFKEDGNRNSDDDFTKDDKPTTEALNFKFDKIEDEPEITAVDRDEAWSAYLEKHTEPNGSD